LVKKRGFPEIGEIVVVTATRITPYSAMCKLEEYPEKEGMIHISEVSGKWVRDIKKFVKLNKTYVVKVLDVDEEKNHITLSLKRVPKIDRTRKMLTYKREQKGEKILEKIAKKQKMTLDEVYDKVGFQLQEEFGELFKAFDLASKFPELLIKRGIPAKWAEIIHETAKESIQKKKIKIRFELEIKSYSGDGIDDIKKFLNDLTNKYGVSINYISAPKYNVEIVSDNPKIAKKQLTENLAAAISEFKDGEVSFKIMGE
jgi:translation initiation factor 2 subunit 1